MARVNVAVVQAAPVVFNLDATLERASTLAAQAAATGAQLVLFPEAFVSGYPRGVDFGARVGSRTAAGRELYRRYWASSIEIPGPGAAHLGQVARNTETTLVIGVIEREGGTLYCASLIFGPDGALLQKRRKLVPTAAERIVWGQGDGSGVGAVDTPAGRVASVICWENYMPLLRAALYAAGVQIYCAPTADARDTWLATMRHVALEGRCFVLSSNQFATRADYPSDYPAFELEDPATPVCNGGSCIIDPLGRVLAGPAFNAPALLTAELDLDEIPRAQLDFDVAGHYARPDVFQLRVDRRPHRPFVRDLDTPADDQAREPR